MAETAGTAGAALPTESPVTSDDIAAFANAEADSSPATPTDAVAPAPATEEPASAGITVVEGTAGPLPLERHKAILERARVGARETAEREWRQRYGWAERYQPNEVENGTRLMAWLNRDPAGFMSWLRQQGVDDTPVGHAPQEPPPPDLRAEDGTPVYSAPQMQKLLEWQMQQHVEPLKRQLSSREEKERLTQTAREAKAQASSLYQTAKQTWPAFADLEPTMLQAMKQDPTLSFQDAYIRAFASEGTSKLQTQWSSHLQATLARKADASTPLPGKQTGTPRKYAEMDTSDVVRQEWEALSRKR